MSKTTPLPVYLNLDVDNIEVTIKLDTRHLAKLFTTADSITQVLALQSMQEETEYDWCGQCYHIAKDCVEAKDVDIRKVVDYLETLPDSRNRGGHNGRNHQTNPRL